MSSSPWCLTLAFYARLTHFNSISFITVDKIIVSKAHLVDQSCLIHILGYWVVKVSSVLYGKMKPGFLHETCFLVKQGSICIV